MSARYTLRPDDGVVALWCDGKRVRQATDAEVELWERLRAIEANTMDRAAEIVEKRVHDDAQRLGREDEANAAVVVGGIAVSALQHEAQKIRRGKSG